MVPLANSGNSSDYVKLGQIGFSPKTDCPSTLINTGFSKIVVWSPIRDYHDTIMI